MGCGCRKKTSETRVAATSSILQFLFCPSCDVVKSKRGSTSDIQKLRCSDCNTKLIVFARPPTAQRLRREKDRRGLHGPSNGE